MAFYFCLKCFSWFKSDVLNKLSLTLFSEIQSLIIKQTGHLSQTYNKQFIVAKPDPCSIHELMISEVIRMTLTNQVRNLFLSIWKPVPDMLQVCQCLDLNLFPNDKANVTLLCRCGSPSYKVDFFFFFFASLCNIIT